MLMQRAALQKKSVEYTMSTGLAIRQSVWAVPRAALSVGGKGKKRATCLSCRSECTPKCGEGKLARLD